MKILALDGKMQRATIDELAEVLEAGLDILNRTAISKTSRQPFRMCATILRIMYYSPERTSFPVSPLCFQSSFSFTALVFLQGYFLSSQVQFLRLFSRKELFPSLLSILICGSLGFDHIFLPCLVFL